jgi:hypothetical protein
MGLSPKLRYWFDKSGTSRHAALSVSAYQPYPTLASGVPALQFNGAAVHLPVSIPLEPATVMIVFRQASEALSHPLLGSSTRFSGISLELGKLRVYSNGSAAGATTARTTTGLTITTVRTAAGAADGIQYNGGGPRYFVGAIMEVVIWGRSLSASERLAAHRALGAKWGISVP